MGPRRSRLLLPLLALLAGRSSAARAADAPGLGLLRAEAAVLGQATWREAARACPAEAMPEGVKPLGPDTCAAEPEACLRACQGGDASSCYWLAQALHRAKRAPASKIMFHRACRLGLPSGCTNFAASLPEDDQAAEPGQACAARTFAKACRLGDPWGCTMSGRRLALGLGVKQDLPAARRALEGSCRHGEEDPACRWALKLSAEIDRRLGPPPARQEGPRLPVPGP